MNAVFAAKQMFLENGLNFEEQLGWYLANGLVVSSRDKFLMAKPIVASQGDDCWNPASPDCWYVHCAVGAGKLKMMLDCAPYPLPKLGWRRVKDGNNALRVYNWNNFKRLVK
jgi:hypothetical protein